MISITSTRLHTGYSHYGDPTVVRLTLSSPEIQEGVNETSIAMELRRFLNVSLSAGGIDETEWTGDVAILLGDVLSALLTLAGHEPGSAVFEHGAPPHMERVLALRCEEPQTCLYAAELASDLVSAVLHGAALESFREDLNSFLKFAAPRRLDPNSRLIEKAARERGLPVRRLDQPPFAESPEEQLLRFGLLQVGHGACSRRFAGPMPRLKDMRVLAGVVDRAALMGSLTRAGFPVPEQDLEFPDKTLATRAVRAAERLGYPVSIRPRYRQDFAYRRAQIHSYGPLDDPEQVRAAFDLSAGAARKVWVERHCAGEHYRFLVIGGRVSAVARLASPAVTGDGESTIDELIARRAGSVPTRVLRDTWLDMLAGDADVDLRLKLQGFRHQAVPPPGARVTLRAQGAAFNGGMVTDVTDHVSDAIKRLAERAVAQCGLTEFAGVDMAIADSEGVPEPPNAVILDVLPDPDLVLHANPDRGGHRDVAGELLDALLPPGFTGRIPLVAVTGTNGKTTTTRMIGHILRRVYPYVGVSTTTGCYVNEERLLDGDVAGDTGAASVLSDERTEVAVLESARGGLIKSGAAFTEFDVGVFLKVTEDHLGEDGVETLEQMAELKAEIIRRTRGTAVLNADDPRVLEAVGVPGADRVLLVSRNPESRIVRAHCASGGVALVEEDCDGEACLMLWEGEVRKPVIPVAAVAATLGGKVGFNVENAMFAAAATWALDVPISDICAGLETFEAAFQFNPARFNVVPGLPFTVVIDNAQNVEGLHRLREALRAFPEARRRTLLLSAVGRRSVEDIRAFAREAALERFDHYACSVRGRWARHVPELLRDTLLECGVPEDAISVFPTGTEAAAAVLDASEPDDLVVLLSGKRVPQILEMIQEKARALNGT